MWFGLRERKVKKCQASDGGLHAVGQSSGAAVPREPRTQIAEELHTGTTTVTILKMQHITAVHNQKCCYFNSALNHLEWKSLLSMSQCPDLPKSGWEKRILHLQMLPEVLEIFEESISVGTTRVTWENNDDSSKSTLYIWYVNLPRDRSSHSLRSVISCKWMQRPADKNILLILISIPMSDTHKSHC